MKQRAFPYLQGFGAPHQSEAIAGALAADQNSPRHVPHGLYAEQVNGTPFTVPRARNLRSWLYRVRPSCTQGPVDAIDDERLRAHLVAAPRPELIGWGPVALPSAPTDFVDGLHALCGAGDPADGPGFVLHRFAATRDMGDRAFMSTDGDLMILPDSGTLHIRTELGWLHVAPHELAVIPRGMLMNVVVPDGSARGVVMEIYQRHFTLPERGVIGANGLADERHFQVPVADFEDRQVRCEILIKSGGRLFRTHRDTSPFDVAAWHGAYTPYRYALRHFNAMGSVTWDHPDPSIFTVMTAPLHHPGESLADLVAFPRERWEVAKGTFRPPYYHRNAAAEINVLVGGHSRDGDALSSGGIYITPCFAPHGPHVNSTARALALDDTTADQPQRISGKTTSLQFETALHVRVAPEAFAARLDDFGAFARAVPSRFEAG